MARRIVIEDSDGTCLHGNRLACCRSWVSDDGGTYYPCLGGSRRVLDPGSFECVDNVDEKWLYLVSPEVHDALAGGEQ